MHETIQTILSVWAASLATILGIIHLVKYVQDKPRILVDADLSFSTTSADAETKGTKIQTDHGWQEVLLTVNAANHGRRPMQITAFVVEESNGNLSKIIPEQLPVVLNPNTSIQVHIQKEWLDDVEVSRFGVVDALGRIHSISEHALLELSRQCQGLPSNKKAYRHKETGDIVKAFQMKDRLILKKRPRGNKGK